MYPVDLSSFDERDLTKASLKYLSYLETGAACNEWFQPSTNFQVAIKPSNVKQLKLFEDQPDCMLLVLHLPEQPKHVVALYLHEKWWHVDDVLKVSNKTRNGLEMVRSTMERVIVLVLSQLVDRYLGEELLFSHHPQTENCKLLWSHGAAVGFYSFKLKGSLCETCISQCYELPVLDTIFVRSHCRRRGFGLLMLEDFCNMFPTEQVLGISSPLSTSMVAGTSSTTTEKTVNNVGGSLCLEKQHCNPSQETVSLNSGFPQISSPAHTSDPNHGPPITTVEPSKSKIRVSVDPDRKELEKTIVEAKRSRRT